MSMNRKFVGALIVGGMNPFFKAMFGSTLLSLLVSILVEIRVTMVTILVIPVIVSLVYASIDVNRKVKHAQS